MVVGSAVFVVATALAAYKCYVSRRPNQLASAIRSAECGKSSMKKTTSVKTTALKSPRSAEIRPLTQQPDVAELSQRSIGSINKADFEPKQVAHVVDETDEDSNRKAVSPTDKDEQLKEKHEDELKIQKLGSLYFSVVYDRQKTALLVSIVRASELPAKDTNTGSSDPYVKLQLLPEKRHKVKTRVLRKTTSPAYDETFTFYGIDFNQLQGITLHFVVLSFDRFSRDDVIGEVLYPLAGVDLSNSELSLCKQISPRHIKVSGVIRNE